MNDEIEALRGRFGRFLVFLFWLHVPLHALVALIQGESPLYAALAGTVLAASYHLMWALQGPAPATRYLSAVALMGEAAILLFLLRGHPWQMDMHMYFFAMLALTIAWLDRQAIIVAALAVSLHHLILLYILPYAVFSQAGTVERVLLHAGIVAFQTAVLVWLNGMLIASFQRIGRMSDEIIQKNVALEERTHEAEEATRVKSMFLANMSHEIRTPMNAILGYGHLIGHTNLDDRQRDYVEKIKGAGSSLLRLINDILDFSKNEAGKLVLEMHDFDLRSTIADQVQLVSFDAQAKGVRVFTHIGPDVPAAVCGDPLRLAQVAINLLSNAVKFSAGGRVEIGLEVVERRSGPEGERAVLELVVADDGIGMTLQQQAALYKPFSQADNSTTRRFGGTGLGLAICKQILEQMGGSISVRSAPGKGSTFTCRFEMAEAGALPTSRTLSFDQIRSLRVLATDDNAASREIVQGIFGHWGMRIDLAASGEEALAACTDASARDVPFDLVLIDWKMPGMDGIELARILQQRAGDGPMPVTLILTAYSVDEAMAEAQGIPISAVLAKPIDPQALLDTITMLFAHKDATVEAMPREEVRRNQVDPHLRGQRVLLVEDNEINLEIATELLTQAGLVVDPAVNGRIACDLVARRGDTYAAVLMDVQMPEMDGLEATRHIRGSRPLGTLPILAMTAHAFEEEKNKCLDAGMDDHIAKPVSPAALVALLNRWLKPVVPETGAAGLGSRTAAADPALLLPAELAPFDLATALERVGGKAALLRRLIVSFGKDYGEVATAMNDALARGEPEDARRRAHGLRSVAGSLGLHEVQSRATDLEQLLLLPSSGRAAIDTEIAALDAALRSAVAAARTLEVPGAGAEIAHDAAAADPERAAQALAELRGLLLRRSLRAREAYDKFASASGVPVAERNQHPLCAAVLRLDYAAALDIVDRIDGRAEAESFGDGFDPDAPAVNFVAQRNNS
ncbi:response regulator [Novosphingobium sp. BL-8A]|uniref:response regulator n=1 Tax=Novosphingobium sp. BL-8A TaxID=3127639 RepID=UPI003756A23A